MSEKKEYLIGVIKNLNEEKNMDLLMMGKRKKEILFLENPI